MEKRLSDRIDQRNALIEEDMSDRKEREGRIEKRLEQRDENLMRMIREIQEAKRIMEEVAAANEKALVEVLGMSTLLIGCTFICLKIY
ncbi:TPA: DUF3967 domain-containing protein [Bacillus cereus]|nr:DUF3967 domain-containing protein [Bacillus cereus]